MPYVAKILTFVLGANEASPPASLISNIPAIIGQAAKSPLGIFALMIVVVALMGLAFFRGSRVAIQLFVFILLFAGTAAFGVALTLVPSLQPKIFQKDEVPSIPSLPIRVLGTQHKKHPDGRYFDFEAKELDALVKMDWDSQVFYVSKSREGAYRPVVVWRHANGGPGDAHGRYLPEGRPGDWKAGDSIYVDPRPRGIWRAKK